MRQFIVDDGDDAIYFLSSILQNLRAHKYYYGGKALHENIDWLESFIEKHKARLYKIGDAE